MNLGTTGAENRKGCSLPCTHHKDEGPQALRQRLAKQPVADMEHLPATIHQLLLSTHGEAGSGAIGRAGAKWLAQGT